MDLSKYIQYIKEFHNNNQVELTFVHQHLDKHLNQEWVTEDQTEIEHILDFLYQKHDMDISKVGYKVLAQKANKWSMKLQLKASKKDTEIRNKDWSISLDFKDWFKFVKLKSKEAYAREWKLMSHCVGGYHGREGIEIHSLRDEKNNPHCTVELRTEWGYINQIKGKGNWSIDPKYIDYVVRFLEKKGKEIRDYDMKNLGYRTIDNIPFADQLGLKDKAYRWRFIHVDKEMGHVPWNMKDAFQKLSDLSYMDTHLQPFLDMQIPIEWWDDPQNLWTVLWKHSTQDTSPNRSMIILQRDVSSYSGAFYAKVIMGKVDKARLHGQCSIVGQGNVIYSEYTNKVIWDGNTIYGNYAIKWNGNRLFWTGTVVGDKNIITIWEYRGRELIIQGEDNRIVIPKILYNFYLTNLDNKTNVLSYFQNGRFKTITMEPMTQYRFHSAVRKHAVKAWGGNSTEIRVLSKYRKYSGEMDDCMFTAPFTRHLPQPPIWSQLNT